MSPSTLIQASQPLFFGAASRPLYGCLHVPSACTVRDTAVVLCQPAGDEQVRAHRACCQLAQRLAKRGFSVLRFDYSGCGDSAGDEGRASLRQWTADVVTAAREVQRRSQAARLCLIGVRLGGPLALWASAELSQATAVLWDAVVDGGDYLERLADRHARKLRRLNCALAAEAADDETAEYLGYAYSPQMRREISLIGRDAAPQGGARRVLLFDSGRRPTCGPLADRLTAGGAEITVRSIPDHQVWQGETERMLVPHRLLEAIVGAVAEACP